MAQFSHFYPTLTRIRVAQKYRSVPAGLRRAHARRELAALPRLRTSPFDDCTGRFKTVGPQLVVKHLAPNEPRFCGGRGTPRVSRALARGEGRSADADHPNPSGAARRTVCHA